MDHRESDDEGLEEEELTDESFAKVTLDAPYEDATAKIYQSLQLQVADLSRYILDLQKNIESFEIMVGSREEHDGRQKPPSSRPLM